MDWTGRTVLVTGASSGIGRAVAVDLARRGATVGLLARSRESLEAVAASCRGYRGATVVLPADVGDPGAVESALARLAGPGRVDAVVHAAGVVEIGAFETVPPDLFDAVLRTNLGGTVATVRAALPRLRPHRGTLVVVGSMLGEVPAPLMSAYVTAKHGVHGLVHTVQAEVGRGGPRVVLVEPAAVRTPIYRKAGTTAGFHGAPIPPVVAPRRAAARVVRALERPRRTVRVGALVRPAVALHRTLPAVYDAVARQTAVRWGLDHSSPTPATPGAVRSPRPAENAVDPGPTRRRLADLLPVPGRRLRLTTRAPGTREA
jgi:NAD(P)-dependent dehydrogenase (short-subunit alcohol dehydrogenase family)